MCVLCACVPFNLCDVFIYRQYPLYIYIEPISQAPQTVRSSDLSLFIKLYRPDSTPKLSLRSQIVADINMPMGESLIFSSRVNPADIGL